MPCKQERKSKQRNQMCPVHINLFTSSLSHTHSAACCDRQLPTRDGQNVLGQPLFAWQKNTEHETKHTTLLSSHTVAHTLWIKICFKCSFFSSPPVTDIFHQDLCMNQINVSHMQLWQLHILASLSVKLHFLLQTTVLYMRETSYIICF